MKRRPRPLRESGAIVFMSEPGTKGRVRPFRHYRGGSRICAAFSVVLAAAWIPVVTQAASASTSIAVSLNFDNQVANEYYLGFQDALQPAGVNATFYINSGPIGTSNKLSWSQVSSLAAAGNDIGGKTVDGTNLTTLSTQQQISEICTDRQNMISHAITPITFAYPSGASNSTIQTEVQNSDTGTRGPLAACPRPDPPMR